MSSTSERSYVVEGMTCDHCRQAVIEEVEQVAEVTAVEVDLAGGRLGVRGQHVSDEAIRAAVDEAGYAVVGSA